METNSAPDPASSTPRKSTLVQERIRALNIQNDRSTPLPRIDNPLSPLSIAGASSKPKPSYELQLPSSATSETARLLKAANVIRKSFDSRTEMFGRSRDAGGAQPSSPQGGKSPRQNDSQRRQGGDSNDINEELDTPTAIRYSGTKGITSDGPRSVKGVAEIPSNKYDQRGGNTTIGTVSSAVPAASTSGVTLSLSEVSELLSPPDICRTVKTHSIMDQAVVEEGYEEKEEDDSTSEDRQEADIAARETREYVARGESNTSRPMAIESFDEAEFTPLKTDTDDPLDKLQTLGGPYRAYANRSRLRSPRVMLTSTDHRADSVDGTQSVTSLQSASSQMSSHVPTLSSRATRFLKDKKERRKGATAVSPSVGVVTGTANSVDGWSNPKTEVFAKNLRDVGASKQEVFTKRLKDVGASKQVIKQSSTSACAALTAASNIEQDERGLRLKCDSPYDELGTISTTDGRPQTINLKPAVPKTSDHVSDLNRDVGDKEQFQTPSLSHYEHQGKSTSDESMLTSPTIESRESPRKGNDLKIKYRENPTKGNDRLYQEAASMDESNYSEVKAKYLFDVREEMSATPRPGYTSESDFDAFPRGGVNSFDGCQAFDLINSLPLIESAFSAMNLGSDIIQNVIFRDPSRGNTVYDDAPSDEDVAIEVEYVEQLEDQRSHAETDSIYTESVRTGSSLRSESTRDKDDT